MITIVILWEKKIPYSGSENFTSLPNEETGENGRITGKRQ
jgi:hypothetical protein